MRHLARWLKRHLNSWDEICTDEKASLRSNLVLFTFAVACFYLVMLVANVTTGRLGPVVSSAAFLVFALVLCAAQLLRPAYQPALAYAFGALALAMCFYLLYTGGMNGYGFLWIFLVPLIGVMVLPGRVGFAFTLVLLALCVVLLCTPVHHWLLYSYVPTFRYLFPGALFAVCLILYLAEAMRHQMQKRLRLANQKLSSFAFTDPLTGAYNRHALASHFGSVEADAHGLCFAVLDLDWFKLVNDEHGHMVGDEMLCHIVAMIRKNMPPGALLYRWGGEEFLLILKTGDEAVCHGVLEGIRQSVQTTPLCSGDKEIFITISAGGCHAREGMPIAACIEQADEHLYEAKQTGRNRVVLR